MTDPLEAERAIRAGNLDDLRRLYQPQWGQTWVNRRGETLLTQALILNDKSARNELSNFLLDQGADACFVNPRGSGTPHFLLDRTDLRDPGDDPALLKRLLDSGADLNGVDARLGTPTQLLKRRIMNVDESLAVPYFDVIFARPDLDLFKIGAFKKSTYQTIEQYQESYPLFWERILEYLADHKITVPEGQAPR